MTFVKSIQTGDGSLTIVGGYTDVAAAAAASTEVGELLASLGDYVNAPPSRITGSVLWESGLTGAIADHTRVAAPVAQNKGPTCATTCDPADPLIKCVHSQLARKTPSWSRSWANFSLLSISTYIFWANRTTFSLFVSAGARASADTVRS